MTDIDDSEALNAAADYLDITQESIKGLRAYASALRKQLAEVRNTVDRAALIAAYDAGNEARPGLVEVDHRQFLATHTVAACRAYHGAMVERTAQHRPAQGPAPFNIGNQHVFFMDGEWRVRA